MKTIGMVGGLGPESTIDYYRLLLGGAKENGLKPPSIFIHSLDVQHLLALAAEDDKTLLVDYLSQSVLALAKAGADLAFFAANTPHLVFDRVAERVAIPLVSIVAATCDAAVARGFKRLGLLGTRFAMEGGFFQDVSKRRGIEIIIPEAADRAFVHSKYVTELIPGTFSPDTREAITQIVGRLRNESGVDGVILGGTELPLLLRDVESPVPLLDTTRIHVDAVITRAAG